MAENDVQKIAIDLEQVIKDYKPILDIHDIGVVVEAGDGIARANGLRKVRSQELVKFENNIFGFAFNLEENQVGIIILGDHKKVSEGMHVQTTGRILSVPVGSNLLGRVVNALGQPVDGKGSISSEKFRPIERIAPSVIERKDVDTPVQTGIKSIDAMVPIGRGQRQLIIGDRQTGKTAIAIDTIINQRGKNLICIYVAIGQKKSAVARTITELERYGAMEHTIVVMASADDPAALQYIAPYSGCAIGEEFMDNGMDALVIYDDLSKHAWAYRQISLLLNRPPGREAYPGDVFYLHSRLLERSARLSDDFIIVPENFNKEEGDIQDSVNKKIYTGPLAYTETKKELDNNYSTKYKIIKKVGSGGSLTALPIIETLLGDVSAYIPTNVISITDGQIYLENNLFNAGIRPAINVGVSVSRVGGEAQSKAMKKVASSLRMDMASYRELAAFAQLGSDLDQLTQAQLNRGLHLQELLKQSQYEPMSLANQVLVLYAGVNGYIDDIELEKIKQWENEFVLYMDSTYAEVVDDIAKEKLITDETEEKLIEALDIFNKSW